MRIVRSPRAIDDLSKLCAYIAVDDAAAAQRIALDILETVEALLPAKTAIGRPGRGPGKRELVIPTLDGARRIAK